MIHKILRDSYFVIAVEYWNRILKKPLIEVEVKIGHNGI